MYCRHSRSATVGDALGLKILALHDDAQAGSNPVMAIVKVMFFTVLQGERYGNQIRIIG